MLSRSLMSLPAISDAEKYANEPIQLAPGFFFNNVLVPTSAETQGNFADYGNPIDDPMTQRPFSGNYIPLLRLGTPFAFRIGPATAGNSVPEPRGLFAIVAAIATLGALRLRSALKYYQFVIDPSGRK